jgi:nicotinate-nucleotide pyrophosphorylase (carboxylating)
MRPIQPRRLLRGIDEIIARALAEDVGRGDLTTLSLVPERALAQGELLAKSDLILAGWPVARRVFAVLDPGVRISSAAEDGCTIKAGQVLARIQGRAQPMLTAERVALNFLQQLSGIATLTARFVRATRGTRARIAATRKTHPGLQRLEKYAVTVGGGLPHRLGLDDGVLIKDNHLALFGSVAEAVHRARGRAGKKLKIEVEVETLDQVEEALAAGADIIMLDNMALPEMRRAVKLVEGRALLEASGGVTLRKAARVARTGVDIISVGALTHSAPAVDISLEIQLARGR